VIRFTGRPTTRTYVVNYSAERELRRSYVAGDRARFRRL
jgi:hypothetical protein